MKTENSSQLNSQSVGRFWIKLDRLAAWVLLIVMIMYGVTGYALIKGFANYETARALHFEWLGVIGLIAFIIHTAYAIHLAFVRWKIWNTATKFLLVIFYVILVGVFGYWHFFYEMKPVTVNPNTVNSNQAVSSTSTEKVFTAETLRQYNGLNGQPAYSAIDGVVYDFSPIFRNGDHEGFKAGLDSTSDYYRYHSASLLKRFEVVGTYQN